MARPQKKGLDYYPTDVDIFSDRKIKILMAQYGSDGYTLYSYLLCEIFKEGYYLKADEDFEYIISSDLNMSYEKIGQIINFFCKRSLLDGKLFTTDKVLTSAGIQRRYQQAVKARAVKTPVIVNERFWLLNKEETETFIKVRQNSDYSEKNNNSSEKNRDSSKNYATKKSKVKESKVKESKVESMSTCVDMQSPFDYQSVVLLFNSLCISLPKVKELTQTRKKAIKSADKQLKGDFESFFKSVEQSDFLSGRNGKWQGCSFDWILKPSNLIKIIEGNYNNRSSENGNAEKSDTIQSTEHKLGDWF